MVFCALSFVNVKKRKQQKGGGDVSNCRTGLLLDFERTKQYSFTVGQPKQTDHQSDVGFGCNLFPLFIPTSGCLYSAPSPKTRINRLFLFSISLARHVCLRVSVYVCYRHPPTSAGSGNILCAPATRFSFYVTKIFFFVWKTKTKKWFGISSLFFMEQWFIRQDQIWAVALFARLTKESLQEYFVLPYVCAYRGHRHRGSRRREIRSDVSAVGNSCFLALLLCTTFIHRRRMRKPLVNCISGLLGSLFLFCSHW